MRNFILIENDAIKKSVSGTMPVDFDAVDWREVPDLPRLYKLVADVLVKKTQAELDADQEPRDARDAIDQQRIGAKVEAAIVEATDNGNPIPLRNLLTKVILKFRDLEPPT